MTTTTRPDAVLAPPDNDVPSPARPTPEKATEKATEKTPEKTPEEKWHWAVLVVVGVVAFGAGVAIGSHLTWRFSIWWKPN